MRWQGFKRVAQTLVYIPHFISFVIVATLTVQLFNIQDGIVNQIIQSITGHTINILGLPQCFKGLIVGQNIWKETGYGTIIFLAALAGVDMELYEAAKVDGSRQIKTSVAHYASCYQRNHCPDADLKGRFHLKYRI